jgi:primosomal protein N' (replication factor Y)
MNLVSVIPITKSFLKDPYLTYFSSRVFEVGSLVEVPIQRRKIPAMVVGIEKLTERRTEVKGAAFKIKSVGRLLSSPFLSEAFIETVQYLANYYMTSPGAVMQLLVPARIFKKPQKIDISKTKPPTSGQNYFQPLYVQSSIPDRLSYYKSIIRESMARGESVFVCTPTVAEAEKIFGALRSGIEDRSYIFHTDQKTKIFDQTYKNIFALSSPILLVGTPAQFFINRHDLGTIIIDHEASNLFRKIGRLGLDVRTFAKKYAEVLNIRIIFGDTVLRVESFYEKSKDSARFSHDTAFLQPITVAKCDIIPHIKKAPNKKFNLISEDIASRIKDSFLKKEKIILFVNRRGLHPMTLCLDCSKPKTCSRCGAPMVLHSPASQVASATDGENKQRHLICHHCLFIDSAGSCNDCGSWNLKSYGFGTESVVEEARRLLSDAKILRLDGDVVKNRVQGGNIICEFRENPQAIIVATEMLFGFMNEPIDSAFVISIDNFFAMPDFRSSERALRLLMRLKYLCQRTLCIQSRLPDHPVLRYAATGNLAGFFRDELDDRRALNYPPFAVLIKIGIIGKNAADVLARTTALQNSLKPLNYESLDFPALIVRMNNTKQCNILIKVAADSWPHKHPQLHQLLLSLDHNYLIEINPDQII